MFVLSHDGSSRFCDLVFHLPDSVNYSNKGEKLVSKRKLNFKDSGYHILEKERDRERERQRERERERERESVCVCLPVGRQETLLRLVLNSFPLN